MNASFFEKITAAIPGMVAVYNIHTGKYLYVNDSVRKILGFTPEDFTKGGISFASTLVHPKDVPRIAKENMQALGRANKTNTNELIVQFEYRMRHKNGSWRWLHTDGSVFSRKKNGEVESVLNVSLDITERKRIEDALIKTDNRLQKTLRDLKERYSAESYLYEAIINSTDDAITSRDLEGKMKTFNPGAERVYGYRAREVIGKNVYSLFVPKGYEDEMADINARLARGESITQHETERLRKDGTKIPVSLTYSPIFDPKGVVIGTSVIARDITERKNLERQKDEFLGIASHELKTPVTSIKAYGQVLQTIFKRKGDEQAILLLQKMDAQINKLTDLIGDLLDVTKIESGNLMLRKDMFDFNLFVREVLQELQLTTEQHRFVVELDKTARIKGDKERLGQVLTNLISNAIKYSPHAKKIVIRSKRSKDFITLSVQDFGIGISKHTQDKVFERFYRASGRKEKTFPGLGLGLYISSEIIKRQGGSIGVRSTEGKGSTFYFTLPLRSQAKSHKNRLAKEQIKHE